MNYPELFFPMDSCISCGQCQTVCPVTQVVGAARAPILDPLFPAFGSHWNLFTHLEAGSFCTQCGRCQEVCPRDIPLPRVLAWARTESRARGKSLNAAETMLSSLKKYDAPFGQPVSEAGRFSRRKKLESGVPVLFYPGCATLEEGSRVPEAWDAVAGVLGVEYAILGEQRACCGGLYYHWGDVEAFQHQVARFRKIFQGLGEEVTVVTDCPHCLYTFNQLYPEFDPAWTNPAVHVFDFLKDLGLEQLELPVNGDKGQEFSYLEPCFLRRLGSRPRGDLEALGQWLPGTGVLGREHCCGAGEGLTEIHPEVPQQLCLDVAATARAAGKSQILVGCPHCRRSLDGATDMPVADLLEVLAEGLRS